MSWTRVATDSESDLVGRRGESKQTKTNPTGGWPKLLQGSRVLDGRCEPPVTLLRFLLQPHHLHPCVLPTAEIQQGGADNEDKKCLQSETCPLRFTRLDVRSVRQSPEKYATLRSATLSFFLSPSRCFFETQS